MTKAEAIQAMSEGQKVTHRYFSVGEFIYMRAGEIYDQDDYIMSGKGFDFWTDRTGPGWQNGWSIYYMS